MNVKTIFLPLSLLSFFLCLFFSSCTTIPERSLSLDATGLLVPVMLSEDPNLLNSPVISLEAGIQSSSVTYGGSYTGTGGQTYTNTTTVTSKSSINQAIGQQLQLLAIQEPKAFILKRFVFNSSIESSVFSQKKESLINADVLILKN